MGGDFKKKGAADIKQGADGDYRNPKGMFADIK
jgi:hypothetical protein